jgi:hypothetical protein
MSRRTSVLIYQPFGRIKLSYEQAIPINHLIRIPKNFLIICPVG